MTNIAELAFPLDVHALSSLQLLSVTFGAAQDPHQVQVTIAQAKCSAIRAVSAKGAATGRVQYVSNEGSASPLLLALPCSQGRLPFSLVASTENPFEAITIVKTVGSAFTIADTQRALLENTLSAKSVSRFTEATSGEVVCQDIIHHSPSAAGEATISVWLTGPSEAQYQFSFVVFLPEREPVTFATTPVLTNGEFGKTASTEGLPKTDFKLQEFRKTFNFNIFDGPEFRKTLCQYEQESPRLRKAMLCLHTEVRNLETSFKRLLATRDRLIDHLGAVMNSQFSPLLKRLDIIRIFSARFKALFVPLETNLKFMIRDVFNLAAIIKMISFCTSTSADPTHEQGSGKKTFEKQSKEFYDWLHKYLSNEKDRPELKLLLKRKTFELAKFDYLNTLNMISNNQYFNQLLENLLKYLNLPLQDGLLDAETFRDNKKSQSLLTGSAALYLHSLLRFNSEKLQFRQKIEACRTNEELTSLIKNNSLNPEVIENHGKTLISSKEPWALNLDLVFPNSPVNDPSKSDNSLSAPVFSLEVDQNPDLSGILYALGGQGKPGWHKEWVVLKNGQLMEFSDWRNGTQPINKPIDVALASVKPVSKEKRQFCLEIITSQGQKHVFQAINNAERGQWIKALYNAGQLTSRLVNKKDLPKINTQVAAPPVITSDDQRGSPVSILSSAINMEDADLLKIVRAQPGNHRCADCSSNQAVEWISMTFLVVVCLKCSSCHRNMGSHISKIKSLKLDNFQNEQLVALRYVDNPAVNAYLEETAPRKLTPDASDQDRLRYIQEKYEQRTMMKPTVDLDSKLVVAVRKIDIRRVIKTLNCGANPNVRLEMSNSQWLEPIFVTLFEYSLRKRITVPEHLEEQEFFLISELLILHGCNLAAIEHLHEEILNCAEAKTYWADRRARVMGA